jgi:small subunit ribosomal protein S17
MSFERRKARVGRVISDKMDKSVVVLVEWRRTHPLYRKSMRRRSRLVVHDVDNSCRIGDLIRIIESRPISKTKRWRVAEILSRQDIAEVQPEDITIDEAVATAAGVQEPEAVEVVSEQAPAASVDAEPEAEPEPGEGTLSE